MTNSPPVSPESRKSEEACMIDDAEMVFRSKRASVPTSKEQKAAVKATRTKLMSRKSTPAPTFKGNGRKRIVDSPLPEDKQVWKRLDFGDISTGSSDAPRCKAELFPASSPHGRENPQQGRGEEKALDGEHLHLAMVCYVAPGSQVVPTDGGPDADAMEKMEGQVEGDTSHNARSMAGGKSKSNGTIVGEREDFPDLDGETKHLLESTLESYQPEGPHVTLAVGHPLRMKEDKLILLASLDTADRLDLAAAQPLLAGGMPEKAHPCPVHEVANLSAEAAQSLSKGASHAGRIGSTEEAEGYDSQVSEGLGGVLAWGGPTPSSAGSGGVYVAPLDQFPPLEKGRFAKIRGRFEDGLKFKGDGARGSDSGSRDPGPGSRQKSPVDGNVSSADNLAGTSDGMPGSSAGLLGTMEPQDTGPVGHAGAPPATLAEIDADARARLKDKKGTDTMLGLNQGDLPSGPRSMADLFRDKPDPDRPQEFVPEKITNMGFASTSKGIPSIHFSGAEIQKLVDNMGFAIVGKFSHSIPNAKQIQKTLENVKFKCGFNWKYINAKHILVQFEDMADYARMLGGPKGTPVWYVDRHPMRVFKWTPEFDVYCESPIAAIWCNLIGLPIHLFDHSALFAIGKLLGTPIQVDRATANRSRLSFARICIEIDITKPPPEEIILDICGREIVQQVRWDKIPAYCQECKHVGHSSEICYAAGKMERPARRNYHMATPRQNQQGEYEAKDNQDQLIQSQIEKDKGRQQKIKGQGNTKGDGNVSAGEPNTTANMELDIPDVGWVGPDITGRLCEKEGEILMLGQDHEFREKGLPNHARSMSYGGRGVPCGGRGGARGSGRFLMGRGPAASANYLSTNQFYSLMENGEYDVEGNGEADPIGMGAQSTTIT